MAFYVRLQDPKDDQSSCMDLSPYNIPVYACSVGQNDQEAGKATFKNANATSLILRGNNLTQGISQGKFWMGLEVSGQSLLDVEFTLKNAKATVVVGL